MPRIKSIPKELRNSDENFLLCQNHIKTKAEIRKLMIVEAEQLSLIEKNQAYKDYLGDEDATLAAYLAQPEIDTKKSVAKKTIDMFEKLDSFGFIPENIEDVSIERLVKISNEAQSSNEADDMLVQARTLSNGDWKNTFKEKAGKPVVDDGHEHIDEEFAICEICHRKRKVSGGEHKHEEAI